MVARPSPVAFATSLAVSAPSFESALSTLALVAPDADRAGALAARVRVRAVGGCGVAVFGGEGFVGRSLDAGGFARRARRVVDCSRGSSAASAQCSLSASASSWSSRAWMSCLIRSITGFRAPWFARGGRSQTGTPEGESTGRTQCAQRKPPWRSRRSCPGTWLKFLSARWAAVPRPYKKGSNCELLWVKRRAEASAAPRSSVVVVSYSVAFPRPLNVSPPAVPKPCRQAPGRRWRAQRQPLTGTPRALRRTSRRWSWSRSWRRRASRRSRSVACRRSTTRAEAG